MLLSKLIASSEDVTSDGRDIDITGLTEDSRKVKPGYLFIATPGVKQDGSDFIKEASEKGAVAVLSSNAKEDSNLLRLSSTNIRKATATLAAAFYPRQPEINVAITGTSGKTSTAQFARELWDALGHNAASIGTLGVVSKERSDYGSLTTPDAITLHKILNDFVIRNIDRTAIEASSHGLELHRLDCVKFKAGAFTNLSRDHLDYHETMEKYFAAKALLFSTLLHPGDSAILNADVPEYATLHEIAQKRGLKILSFGKKGRDFRLTKARPDAHGQLLSLSIWDKTYDIFLPVIGEFQAWNALCAAALVISCDGHEDATIKALGKLTGVPGRLQYIGASSKGGAVFVDYAHKPDALENVLQAVRPHVAAHKGLIGVVFGCGGNRDRGKRPLMGAIAQKRADWVIVTDDNPRHEDAAAIRAEVLAGCIAGPDLHEIGDRHQAIAAGIDKLGANDILIIAGKGHEPGQIVGDTILPFDDSEEARKVLGL